MRSILFLGDDENGDLIPTRALRDRLKQQRRDVFPPASLLLMKGPGSRLLG